MQTLKRLAICTTCVMAFAPAAFAQKDPVASRSGSSGTHAVALAVPDRPVWLGTVRLPAAVLADGKPLAAGTRIASTTRLRANRTPQGRRLLPRLVQLHGDQAMVYLPAHGPA